METALERYVQVGSSEHQITGKKETKMGKDGKKIIKKKKQKGELQRSELLHNRKKWEFKCWQTTSDDQNTCVCRGHHSRNGAAKVKVANL